MTNPEEVIRVLIGNLEQAAQRDWPTEKIFTEVLKRFPAGILELLKLATPEQAIETVTKGVPDDWALKGIRGRGLIADLLTMLKGG
jgi:hypothetical protein